MKQFFYRNRAALLLLTLMSGFVSAESPYPIATPIIKNVEAYILMDANSGVVLAEHDADVRREPASLTKMMTSYVIGEALRTGRIRNEDKVLVGKNASASTNPKLKGSSLMFLEVNEKVPVSLLNKGIIIQSGNDACIAMAEFVSGSQNVFISEMNNYVKKFGLKNTHFETVHGLDSDGQYSTPRDMALIGQAIIKNLPEEYAIYKEKEFTHGKVTPIHQYNRNGLLWDDTLAVDGIKTGHTNGAGFNIVASATERNMRLIAVIMGADSEKNREEQAKKLLVWGFRQFETLQPVKPNQELINAKIWYGKSNTIKIGSIDGIYVTVPIVDVDNLKVTYKLNNKYLTAPIKKGTVVGQAIYSIDDKQIAEHNIQALDDVDEAGFLGRIWDWICLHIWLIFN